MRRTPTGQRPQLNPKNSAGWSWPRLLPIHERQTRTPLENDFAPGSSKNQPQHETSAQDYTFNEMERQFPTEHDSALRSPTASTTDSVVQSHLSAEARPLGSESSSDDGRSGSPVSGIGARPPRSKNVSTSESKMDHPIGERSDTGEQTHTEPRNGLETKAAPGKAQPSSDEDQGGPRSLPDKPNDDVSKTTEQHSADSGTRPRTVSFETKERPSALKDQSTGRHTNAAPEPSKARGPKHGSMSTDNEAPKSRGAADEEQRDESSIAPEHREMIDMALLEEEPASPLPTPIPNLADRVSIPADPIPYYATPKIMVHKPSQSFQSETSGPRTIDEILANEHRIPLPQESLITNEIPSSPPISSVISQLPDTPTGPGVHRVIKVKKRSLYLRKARNLAARKTILKMTLGRQLAGSTKQALRQLAHGEAIVDEDPISSQAVP